ncbi:MAG: hypothetical protein K0R15_532 [Clostridiales bacterium]|jgi:hypothetical protein|nr:hypothetical protein [Clostridiales bacterium]
MGNVQKKTPNKQGNSKVTKYKKSKPVDINITILIFAFVFVYILINSLNAFGKKNVSIYEVTNSSIIEANTYTAFALREQEPVVSTAAGYITYYYKDGTKASVNDIVCSIGPTKQTYNSIQGMNGETSVLTSENINTLKTLVNNYTFSYNSNEYGEIYNFKYQIENKLFEIYNLSNYYDTNQLSSQNLGTINRTSKSGLISYTITGYEDVTSDNLTEKIFTDPLRESKYVLSEPTVAPGDIMYKIVSNKNWSLVFPVPKSDLDNFNEIVDSTIDVKFLSNNITASANVTKIMIGDTTFAKLNFTTLLPTFINNVFLDIEITYDSAKGLKIPNTAIVEKEFYKIPLDCIFNSKGTDNITVDVTENGLTTPVLKQVEIYFSTDEYALIASTVVEGGTSIARNSSTDKFIVGEKISLEGVYSVNKGYTVFRRIEKQLATDNFTIINKGTPYGISLFDHIVINAKNVTETEIIY